MFAILTVSFFAGLRFLISAAYDWCQAKLGGEPEWKWINLHLGWRWHLPLGPHSVSSGLLAGAPAVQVCHSAEFDWEKVWSHMKTKVWFKNFMTLRTDVSATYLMFFYEAMIERRYFFWTTNVLRACEFLSRSYTCNQCIQGNAACSLERVFFSFHTFLVAGRSWRAPTLSPRKYIMLLERLVSGSLQCCLFA